MALRDRHHLIRRHRRRERAAWRAYAKHGADPLGIDIHPRLDEVAVARALGHVTKADRDALLLMVWADLTYDDIATAPGRACAAERQEFGEPNDVSGARADTMILVRIDPSTGDVLVVSIPRDLMVDVPGCGTEKINAAFNDQLTCGTQRGGIQLLVATITRSLGVPISHVIEVQFPQFAALVDTLGGLRVQVPEPGTIVETPPASPGFSEPAPTPTPC